MGFEGRTPSMIQTHVALCWEARVRRCEKIMIQELIKVSRFFFQWDPAAKIIFAMGLQPLLYTPDSFCHSGRSCKHNGRAQLRTCAAMKTGVSLWICSILEQWRWRLAYGYGNALKDSSAYYGKFTIRMGVPMASMHIMQCSPQLRLRTRRLRNSQWIETAQNLGMPPSFWIICALLYIHIWSYVY